jgi:hypothetical protein
VTDDARERGLGAPPSDHADGMDDAEHAMPLDDFLAEAGPDRRRAGGLSGRAN